MAPNTRSGAEKAIQRHEERLHPGSHPQLLDEAGQQIMLYQTHKVWACMSDILVSELATFGCESPHFC